jgi:hypothetical protein
MKVAHDEVCTYLSVSIKWKNGTIESRTYIDISRGSYECEGQYDDIDIWEFGKDIENVSVSGQSYGSVEYKNARIEYRELGTERILGSDDVVVRIGMSSSEGYICCGYLGPVALSGAPDPLEWDYMGEEFTPGIYTHSNGCRHPTSVSTDGCYWDRESKTILYYSKAYEGVIAEVSGDEEDPCGPSSSGCSVNSSSPGRVETGKQCTLEAVEGCCHIFERWKYVGNESNDPHGIDGSRSKTVTLTGSKKVQAGCPSDRTSSYVAIFRKCKTVGTSILYKSSTGNPVTRGGVLLFGKPEDGCNCNCNGQSRSIAENTAERSCIIVSTEGGQVDMLFRL